MDSSITHAKLVLGKKWGDASPNLPRSYATRSSQTALDWCNRANDARGPTCHQYAAGCNALPIFEF